MTHLASRRLNFFKFFLFLYLCHFTVFAQVVTKQKTVTKQVTPVVTVATRSSEIEIDMAGRAFSTILPFDVPFILAGTKGINDKITLDKIISVECFYKNRGSADTIPKGSDEDYYKNFVKDYGYAFWQNNSLDTKYRLPIRELDPNKKFTFFFRIKRKLTDEERADLIASATRIVPPLIQAKAKSGRVSLSNEEIGRVISQLKNLLSESLSEKNQKIENSSISNTNNEIISNAIIEVGYAFETIAGQLESIDYKVKAFDNDITNLTQFLGVYKVKAVDEKKAENIAAIENIVQLIKSIYKYPKDANALKSDVGKSYLEQFEQLKAELKNVALPSDSPFEKIRESIVDHLGDLVIDFNEYKLDLTNQTDVTNVQIDNLVAAIVNYIEDAVVINGTSVNSDFVTRSNSFITADIGVALIPSIGKMVPYIGSNIYFRPINRDRPLLMQEFIVKDFWRRFSMLLGLTYSTLKKDNYRNDLMSTFNLITGAGFRVADFVKINGGVIWYTQVNPNPLNTNNTVRGSGFVSLSFDIDVKTVFHRLFTPTDLQKP